MLGVLVPTARSSLRGPGILPACQMTSPGYPLPGLDRYLFAVNNNHEKTNGSREAPGHRKYERARGSPVVARMGSPVLMAPLRWWTWTTELPGKNCAAGGTKVEFGLDNDGELHEDEISKTIFVCDGEDGAGSDPILISSSFKEVAVCEPLRG